MSRFQNGVTLTAFHVIDGCEKVNSRLGAVVDWVVNRLVGFLLPAKHLSATFNPEMDPQQRHLLLWIENKDGSGLDLVGVRLNHPEVVSYLRASRLQEIVRQAVLCGYRVTYVSTGWAIHDVRAYSTELQAACDNDKGLTEMEKVR